MITGAVIQAGSVGFDTKKTIAKMADLLADTAKKKADIAVLPEAFVGGYPKGLTFGATVGGRTKRGREEFSAYFNGSIAVPGPETDEIAKMAKANNIFVVVGVIEREIGTLYCTVLFFDNTGSFLGKHRKLMPTASERLVWGFGDGSTMPVFKTKIGKVGSVICWENYMPMLRMAMYSKGIQLYCAPTADDRETWLPTMRTVALEGRCFVLSSNQFIRRESYPDIIDYRHEGDPDDVIMKGGSCIISPLGEILAGPLFGNEGIITAELDPRLITQGKYDFDVAGHYSRPDIFTLDINTAAQKITRKSGE